MAAYINQVDVKNKTSQPKDGGRLSSRKYLLPLKDKKNVTVFKSMLLSTLGPKSNGVTVKNGVISSNFMVWKSCGMALFPHSFRQIARNYAETVLFQEIK